MKQLYLLLAAVDFAFVDISLKAQTTQIESFDEGTFVNIFQTNEPPLFNYPKSHTFVLLLPHLLLLEAEEDKRAVFHLISQSLQPHHQLALFQIEGHYLARGHLELMNQLQKFFE